MQMTVQFTRVDTETRSWSQVKTVEALCDYKRDTSRVRFLFFFLIHPLFSFHVTRIKIKELRTRVIYPRQINKDMNPTATYGIPRRFVRLKILNARPSCARPYSVRELFNKPEFPDDHALVNTTALIIEGTILIPARLAAITKGDAAAVPDELSRFSSVLGTTRPTMNMDSM